MQVATWTGAIGSLSELIGPFRKSVYKNQLDFYIPETNKSEHLKRCHLSAKNNHMLMNETTGEMDKCIERYTLSKQTQEEIENLNKYVKIVNS